MPPPLPARAPHARLSNNQHRSYDQVEHQSYPDSTTYHEAEGYGGYRDVAHHYDEDGEEEAVVGYQEEEGQEEQEDEEVQEQEQEDEQEEEYQHHYPGGEPVEYDGEEEQGYNAHNYGGYGAGQMVEQNEDEYDDGYGY